MPWPVNPRRGKTTHWRAGCGKTASPVRRGEGRNPMRPSYPINGSALAGRGPRRSGRLWSRRGPDKRVVRATRDKPECPLQHEPVGAGRVLEPAKDANDPVMHGVLLSGYPYNTLTTGSVILFNALLEQDLSQFLE